MSFKVQETTSSEIKKIKTIYWAPPNGTSGEHYRIGKVVFSRTTGGTPDVIYRLGYPLIGNITQGDLNSEGPLYYDQSYTGRIVPNQYYTYPGEGGISVTNAELDSYDPLEGKFTISNPTRGAENITITGTCPAIVYALTVNMHSTGTYEAPEGAASDSSVRVSFTAGSHRIAPAPEDKDEYITVTDSASWTYVRDSGMSGHIDITNITENISVSISCPAGDPLAAPTIALSGDVLSIVDNDGNATAFDIYIDGVKVVTVPKSN